MRKTESPKIGVREHLKSGLVALRDCEALPPGKMPELDIRPEDEEDAKVLAFPNTLQPDNLEDVSGWWVRIMRWMGAARVCRERQLREAHARIAELERLNARYAHGLDYAGHFLVSPSSFSHDEFRAVANEILAASANVDLALMDYRGKVPHLDERAEAERGRKRADLELVKLDNWYRDQLQRELEPLDDTQNMDVADARLYSEASAEFHHTSPADLPYDVRVVREIWKRMRRERQLRVALAVIERGKKEAN